MSSGYVIRKNDFPGGIATAADVERLGALLNPQLRQASDLASRGVNLGKNLDGQVVSADLTTPASDWTDFVPATWTNSGGAYSNFGWRADPRGVVWVRGRITTLPVLGTVLATLPALAAPAATHRFAVDAAGAYGALEIAANGQIKQIIGSVAGTLDLPCSFASAKNSAGAYSCFPFQIRLTDGRRPGAVLLNQVLDAQASPGAP